MSPGRATQVEFDGVSSGRRGEAGAEVGCDVLRGQGSAVDGDQVVAPAPRPVVGELVAQGDPHQIYGNRAFGFVHLDGFVGKRESDHVITGNGVAAFRNEIIQFLNGICFTFGIVFRIRLSPVPIAGFTFDSDYKLYYLIIPITLLMTILARNLVNGYIGRAFIALRESEVAAQTIGIDLARYKTIAFAISAFYTGVAGGLFAYLITYLSPDAFTIELSVDFIAMIVIGGMGSILGSIIGAVILTGMQQVLAGLLDLQILIFGISLIVFMIFMPKGISGMIYDLKERFVRSK